jgi:tRNA A-37 threonylcarbamoyl transferase component Bud32
MSTPSVHDEPSTTSSHGAAPSPPSPSPPTAAAGTPGKVPTSGDTPITEAVLSRPGTFGPYVVIAELAHGGMGVVYKVRDSRLGRNVALKMIRSGGLAGAEEIERFTREYRAVAQLRHPHIVPLYDVGTLGGHHYFTMELAAGSLSDQRVRFQSDRRAAVALLAKVARAVDHVHAHGLLHRDLKPGNILLRDDGEPLISDFGLAKSVGIDPDLTRTGGAVGTPSYMAPEQLAHDADRLGPTTDVWSLGVIAYELLCGSRPFVEQLDRRLSDAISKDSPRPPRKACPGLDRDLETIVLKCLEKAPRQRYASAGALADDLEAWLAGEPIAARPLGWLRHTARWARRHPGTMAAAAILVIAFAMLPFVLPERDANTYSEVVAIQNELVHRRPVTLIGETGARPWYRLIGSATVDSNAGDAALRVSAGARTLLILLPDPKITDFRLEADVRIDSYPTGAAGLFVAHSRHDDDKGPHYAQAITKIWFFPQGAPEEVQPQFVLAIFDPERSGRFPGERPIGGVDRRTKSPTGWYHMVIEVGPAEAMRAQVDDVPIGELSREARVQEASDMVRKRQALDRVSLLNPAFLPRGGLGLYIDDGASVSFRRVIITPAPLAGGN